MNRLRIAVVGDVKTPTTRKGDAGIDFYVPNDFEPVELKYGESVVIPSNIKAEVKEGYALIAFNKSGVAVGRGLQVGACVVDHIYQGEIHVHLTATKKKITACISPGDKIVQFLLIPVEDVEDIRVVGEKELFKSRTERGAGWKGSTGTK